MSEPVHTSHSHYLENRNSDDIFMICDSTARRFQMDNCTTVVLESDVGVEEIWQKIRPGLHGGNLAHDISQFKLLILMIGRADFNIITLSFKIKWYALMEVIMHYHPNVNILVTPSLSSPHDSVDMRVKAEERSELMLYYAHDNVQVHFTRPQKEFWLEQTPIDLYYDYLGNLTELGVAEIRSQLMHKIELFNLLDN